MIPLPTLNAQSLLPCADGLADQRGARHCDAHRRHVTKRSEHHDDLRRRAVDGSETHLHQLKQREAQDIRRDQQPHRKTQLHLAPQRAAVKPRGQVRSKARCASPALRNQMSATATPTSCAALVAQAEPATPMPKLNMNS